MFNNIFKGKQLPVSYKIEHPNEIVELFSRLTLHHQTALIRLISRNLVLKIDDEAIMGYEMSFDVKGAVIQGTIDEDLT
tara:strand:+ start:346 stop:582 length:237 start_codon:yes stop_codon:yes gene_type:complete